MPGSDMDRWACLDDPGAVADAAERLDQFARIPSEQQAWARIIEWLAPVSGDTVLDVGAGCGDIGIQVARRVAPNGHVMATDLSPGLLAQAADRARRAGVTAGFATQGADARALPWAEDCYDRALCHWVLLHVDDPAAVIREVRRVVRPGGCAVFVEVDWATLTVHPGNPEFTDAVVAANVARQQDGRMGRKLAPLLRDCGFGEVTVAPIVDVETAPEAGGSWLDFLATRIPVAEAAGVDSHAMKQWWREIEHAARRERYFFSLTQFAVTAMVPHL